MFSKQHARCISCRLRIKVFSVILIILLSLSASTAICAQIPQNNGAVQDANSAALDTAAVDTAAGLTVEQLQLQKKLISESSELSEEIKAKINEVYDQAITQLQQAIELEGKIRNYSQGRISAPGDLEKINEQLAQQATFSLPEVAADIALTQAEQNLTEAKLTVEQAIKNATTWENEPKRRAERRTKIPEESNTAKQKIEEIKNKLATAAAEGLNAELVRASRTLMMIQQRALEAQITANTEELLFYDTRREVLPAQRDLAARQLANREKLMGFWQQKVSELRQKQAEATQQEAIRAKEDIRYAHPVIHDIAEQNVELAKLQTELVDKIEKTSQYFHRIDEQLIAIQNDFQEVQEKVEKAGKITNVMGVLLLAKRNELPKIGGNKKQIQSRLSEITLAQLALIQYDKEWSELGNIEGQTQNVIDKIETPLSDTVRAAIYAEVVTYLQNRRKTLQAISDLYLDYSISLANLDTKEGSFVQTVQEYEDFIDKNILWVKSTFKFSSGDLPETVTAVKWLARGEHWQRIFEVVRVDFKKDALPYLAIIAFFILLVVLHHRMHVIIENLSGKVQDVNTDSFMHTLKVCFLTLLLATTWPVIILFLRWRLSMDASPDDFTRAFTGSLGDLAVGIFIFELIRHMVMPSGLMQSHFRIRVEFLDFTRKHFRWFFALVIPLAFVLQILQLQQTSDQMYSTMGRLIFIIILIVLAVFLLVLLRPTGPVLGLYLRRHRNGWVEYLRFLWYPLCLIIPLSFSVLAAMGYFYAACHLYEKLINTLVLVFLLFMFWAMLTRWLIVMRRRLSVIELEKRKAAAQDQAIEAQTPTSSIEPDLSQKPEIKPEITIYEISQQTNRMINAIITALLAIGLWYVWKDVLPALGALDDIQLWKITDIQGTVTDIVSLSSLIIAVLILIMTIIIARNVPGLMEIVILRRLPLDRGVRFAIITLSRYVLIVVGVVLTFKEIGIGWSKVQWLIAAMTVGLGFGLQEIFANFVSGLIILFEQPVRVEDVVTVGDVTGVVTKIKIRATTIRRWDQRELIVPNKEFITGHLINWTLSDKILRRDFTVGIAYGSDIAKAEETLYKVAEENPLVLDNPKPVVLFQGFGDSSLEFELRVFITGIENYIPVWHAINCAIDEAFRKAGIEIAFPQRDLHIRSNDTIIPIDNIKKLE